MILLYFLLETPIGLPDFCPYMYVRRGSGFTPVIVISNIKTAICRLKRRFGETSFLKWRLDNYNQPIQSAGIVQNNPPGNSVLFDLN